MVVRRRGGRRRRMRGMLGMLGMLGMPGSVALHLKLREERPGKYQKERCERQVERYTVPHGICRAERSHLTLRFVGGLKRENCTA